MHSKIKQFTNLEEHKWPYKLIPILYSTYRKYQIERMYYKSVSLTKLSCKPIKKFSAPDL